MAKEEGRQIVETPTEARQANPVRQCWHFW
jgi:hypothetical protein